MKIKILVLAALLLLSTKASSAVIYQFNISNLTNNVADFELTLEFDDYVTTTGLFEYGQTLTSPLGYDIGYVGTNNIGDWLFSLDNSSAINDGISISFSATSFAFYDFVFDGYITSPGTYNGFVSGNDAVSFFDADAVLTVFETNGSTSVDEPQTLMLFLLSVMCLLKLRRTVRR